MPNHIHIILLLSWCTILMACFNPKQRPEALSPTSESTMETPEAPEAGMGGVWMDLTAAVRIPPGDDPTSSGEHWLMVSISQDNGDVILEGCTAGIKGPCQDTMRTSLSDAERQAFATHMNDILSMPRCEPLAFGPADHPFELSIGAGETMHRCSAHVPVDWFTGEPAHAEDPCYAEVRMAYLLYTMWESRRPPSGG